MLEATDHAYDREDVRSWLQDNVVDLGDAGWDNSYGAGYLSLYEPPDGSPTPTPTRAGPGTPATAETTTRKRRMRRAAAAPASQRLRVAGC